MNKNRKMKRSTKTAVIGLAALGILGAGALGSLAYLTDTEQTDNIFTAGDVKLDLEEPTYPGNDSAAVKDQTPNRETPKDPQVENTGINDMVTFMEVSVPTKNITEVTTDAEGNAVKGTRTAQTLFYMKDADALKQDYSDSLHTGADDKWVILDEHYVDKDGNTVAAPVEDGAKIIRVGYKDVLSKGEKTQTLFDKVQLKNFIETEVAQGELQKINVKAYGIQADDLTTQNGDIRVSDGMSDETLASIWKLYYGQSGDKISPDADTTTEKNLKGDGSENPTTDSQGNVIVASFQDANGNTVQATSLQDAIDRADGATIVLENDLTIGGFKARADQTVDIDLNGHELTFGSTVGSAGTETLGMQLLKGSDVTISNGTILPGENAKIMIQNYSNLTLDSVVIDGSGSDKVMYCLSNNCGNVVITGDTQIIAPDGAAAFDLYYGMSSNYDDGISVVFDDHFTGYVKGTVEYGKAGRVTDADWMDKASLDIYGEGTFDITFDAPADANIEIHSGDFQNSVADYVADGSTQVAETTGRYIVQ